MPTQSEKSPLTHSASGQENGPAFEARGLSREDNDTASKNLSQGKCPAPELASEAADQRPGTEGNPTEVRPTAEVIVDPRTAGSNETSSKVSRADGLTAQAALAAIETFEIVGENNDSREPNDDDRFILTEFIAHLFGGYPVEQPAAAQRDTRFTHPGCDVCACPAGVCQSDPSLWERSAPAPADERAALPEMARKAFAMAGANRWHLSDPPMAEAIVRAVLDARAASASETDAEGVQVLETRTGTRCEAGSLADRFARSVDLDVRAVGSVPAMAEEAATTPTVEDVIALLQRAVREIPASLATEVWQVTPLQVVWVVATLLKSGAPQPPAQADARVGLTEEQRIEAAKCIVADWVGGRKTYIDGEAYGAAVELVAFAISRAHPGQPEPRASAGVIAAALAVIECDRAQVLTDEHIDALDNAIKIQSGELKLPEPRAEVTADDQQDAMRWRALMKGGDPSVYVERTERRVIQHTQTVAFSSPNLADSIGVGTSSEMWIKRYVMFAWWARENEHRNFAEAVDAIRTGAIQ